MTAVDVKYMPTTGTFLVAAEGPWGPWKLSFHLLSQDFELLGSYVPDQTAFANPCNHNPGLIGDATGALLDETAVPVFFGSGTVDASHPTTPCWNPGSWDIRTALFYPEVL